MDSFIKESWQKPAQKFKALGHPLRLWISAQLVHQEHCVQELVELTEFDFSTVSQHLAALKSAGIVADEKRGKQVFYRLACDCVREFLKCIDEKRRQKGEEK